MSTSPTISQESPNRRRCRAHIWVAIAVTIQVGILLSPIRIVSLRSGDSGRIPYLVLLLPAAWSCFMLFRYRTPRERVVAWCSLALTAFLFLLVGSIRT